MELELTLRAVHIAFQLARGGEGLNEGLFGLFVLLMLALVWSQAPGGGRHPPERTPTPPSSREGIAHVEEIEFAEVVGVTCVRRPHAMLLQQCREVALLRARLARSIQQDVDADAVLRGFYGGCEESRAGL